MSTRAPSPRPCELVRALVASAVVVGGLGCRNDDEPRPLAPSAAPSASAPSPAASATTGAASPAPATFVDEPTAKWLAERRKAQLAEPAPAGLFTDFQLRDRQPESGIDFVHHIVADAGRNYKAVHYDHGNGVAAADVDGDGRLDLYFTSQLGGNALYRNLGDGRFEDVTEAWGVALADRVSVSATFADLDNDGDADLFVTTVRMGNVLFENDGRRFVDVTERATVGYVGHSSGTVPFDYDKDGLLDLFVTNVGVYTTEQRGEGGYYIGLEDAFHGHLHPERAERSLLYRNRGGLRFEEVSAKVGIDDQGWSGDATAIDANDDGWLDLYVLNMQGDDHLYVNRGGARFEEATARHFPKTGWGAMGVKVLDVDADGRLDLFTSDMHSDMTEDLEPLAVDRERAKARTPPKHLGGDGGERSLFGNVLYRSLGEGRFEEVSDAFGVENYWPWGVSAGDLNADGFEDLFLTSSMNYPFRYGVNAVLLSHRGERFVASEFRVGAEPRRGGVTHEVWFTLDCRGWDRRHELCARCASSDAPECQRKDAEGRIQVAGALGSRSSVLLDLDGDGDLDVVTNEFNAPPMVLVSDLAERHPPAWVELELRGTTSNRDGLGALVTVDLGSGRRRVVRHDGKSGYLTHSRMPLYVGLGDATRIEAIDVAWPAGEVQHVEGTGELRRRILIEEPRPAPGESR